MAAGPLLWMISVSQIGTVAAVAGENAVASAVVAGVFLVVNSLATVMFTRYVNRHDETVKRLVKQLPKRRDDEVTVADRKEPK